MIFCKVFSIENAALNCVMSCIWSIIYLELKLSFVADMKQSQFLNVVYCKNSQDIIAGLPQFDSKGRIRTQLNQFLDVENQ